MVIGDRLKTLREAKNFSQGDIEKKTGLLRRYVFRVENGHTVPAVETLGKFARALELPLYHLRFDGDKPPASPTSAKLGTDQSLESTRQGKVLMGMLVPLLAKMCQDDSVVFSQDFQISLPYSAILVFHFNFVGTRGKRKGAWRATDKLSVDEDFRAFRVCRNSDVPFPVGLLLTQLYLCNVGKESLQNG